MTGSIPDASKNKVLPYLILLAAICFLFILLSMIRPGVFFSGDGGLKYLIAKQLEHSREFKYILSAHPLWVKQIWEQGYYPFRAPFVYTVNNDYMVSFPVFFELLSAFFYKQFGYYGLYIIPALNILLTWISFLGILTVLNIQPVTKALGIFLLAFCTPLTFYGAVFWEHSLGTFLVFNAIIYFFQQRPSFLFALMSGLLSGMAIWFREETIILLGLMMLTIAWNNRKFKSKPDTIFIIAAVIPVLFYFLFNDLVYGSFFGLHGDQITRHSSFGPQLWKGVRQFFKINLAQLAYFPVIGFCLFILFFLFRQHREKTSRLFQLSLVILLFMVIAPFLLPSDGDKQWGPRFFLPVIPPAIVVVTIFADDHDWQGFFRKYKGWAALSLLVIIYSVYLNVYKAGDRLRNDYSQRVYPALKYIETEPCNNIIVDNQYISQELTEEFNNKNFFLLTHEGQLANLLNELKMAGQQQCIFISVDKEKTSFPDTIMTNKNILWKPFGSYSTGIYTIP